MACYAKIIIDLHHQKVDRIYTYQVDEPLANQIREGMLVEIPFGMGDRRSTGYVVGFEDEEQVPQMRLKKVVRLISPEPVFSKRDLKLAEQMQKRYHAPLSACLALFIPKIPSFTDPKVQKVDLLRRPNEEEGTERQLGKSQQLFLQKLMQQGGKGCLLKEIRKEAPITKDSLVSLMKKQYVHVYEESEGKPPTAFVSGENQRDGVGEDHAGGQLFRSRPLPLNAQQLQAREAISEAAKAGNYQGFLLHGITGSGKTEVYMQCIQRVLDQGKQAILLVPEISLTPQLIRVFNERFGSQVGITHSRMTDRERSIQWRLAKKGEYQVMIGPRSAVFTPFENLGLIIVDEEHETSYKSEQMAPHYHAAEVAQMRCEQVNCPMVLGSATPSTDSFYRAQCGELTLLSLPRRAVAGAQLPQVKLVDMRSELEAGNLSIFCRDLLKAIRQRLERKEQVILFLNRKGYATFVNCRECGFVLKCPRCYLPYTYHKDQNKLICHHCGKEAALPAKCPDCESKYIRQFGVGTQRVQEEVEKLFPGARVMRMDMGTMKTRDDYMQVYEDFRSGRGDILIGTQMIAKGFDFPNVTLVGVLAADMTLYSSDYHSTERTFQLITQVAGRAGRADKPGEVLVQTYSPEHYCIQMAQRQDYEGFYRNEIAARKLMECPPFTHLAQVVLTGPSEDSVIQGAGKLGRLMAHYAAGRQIEILGPSPAALGRINNIFRWKLLIKCKEEERLRAFVDYCCDKFLKEEKRVTVLVDIDPVTIV